MMVLPLLDRAFSTRACFILGHDDGMAGRNCGAIQASSQQSSAGM